MGLPICSHIYVIILCFRHLAYTHLPSQIPFLAIVPGAINMPFTSFMDASGKQLGLEDLSMLFKEAGVDLGRPFWVTCGSGVTACHVVLAAHLLGHTGSCVYDGSWSEWFKRASPELVISEGK